MRVQMPVVNPWLRTARRLWALPCSLIGLAIGAFMLLGRGKVAWSAGTFEFTHRQRLDDCGRMARRLRFRGIVFGHVILAVTGEELQAIRPHERVHVRQYERWGVLFFAAYLSSSLWQLLHRRSPYWQNAFEVEARRLGS